MSPNTPLYPVQAGLPQPMHFRGLTLGEIGLPTRAAVPYQVLDLTALVTAGRLDQFEGGSYSNIRDVLFDHRTDEEKYIKLELWSSPGREKVSSRARKWRAASSCKDRPVSLDCITRLTQLFRASKLSH